MAYNLNLLHIRVDNLVNCQRNLADMSIQLVNYNHGIDYLVRMVMDNMGLITVDLIIKRIKYNK